MVLGALAQESGLGLEGTILFSLAGGASGQQPVARLTQTPDGTLFGTTARGGLNSAGVIFRIRPDGSGYRPIFHFPASPTNPFGLVQPAGLTPGEDGWLYGVTGAGGAHGYGSVFRLRPDGSGFTTLRDFTRMGGYQPAAELLRTREGRLFGSTQFGGSLGLGTLFSLEPDGSGFATLYSFGATAGDPQNPQAPLLEGADGRLYGTSPTGGYAPVPGTSGGGTVFVLNLDGSRLTVLHRFTGTEGDGLTPAGGLVQVEDGFLFGTTQEGGSTSGRGGGTIFRIGPDGRDYSVVYRFSGGAQDGLYPRGGLVLGNDGALYGTTEFGGTANRGTLFRFEPASAKCALVRSFGVGQGDPQHPKGALLRALSGGLFGTAPAGGANDVGAVFRFGPAPAVIAGISSLPDRSVQLKVRTAPCYQYGIEASSDRLDWVALGRIHSQAGMMLFRDGEAAHLPNRYYRVVWEP